MAVLVVLDASVVIGFRDPNDPHHEGAVAAFRAHRSDRLVLPASAYAEVLVGAMRHGKRMADRVERFIVDFAIHIEPIGAEIARRAARLRARSASLQLADAFVLAAGDVLDATHVLTADRAWPSASRRATVI